MVLWFRSLKLHARKRQYPIVTNNTFTRAIRLAALFVIHDQLIFHSLTAISENLQVWELLFCKASACEMWFPQAKFSNRIEKEISCKFCTQSAKSLESLAVTCSLQDSEKNVSLFLLLSN